MKQGQVLFSQRQMLTRMTESLTKQLLRFLVLLLLLKNLFLLTFRQKVTVEFD
jgi:hypothetical protein